MQFFCFLVLGKIRISNAHGRKVQDTNPPGCPFQSVALAISHAYACDRVNEERVRAILVTLYKELDPNSRKKVAEAKLGDKSSFFYMTRFEDARMVSKYWTWYLKCLSYLSTTRPDDDCVVRMPLDCIDLRFLAHYFNAGIIVSKLDSPALHFLPGFIDHRKGRISVHLVNHKSLWAPLLDKMPTTEELHGQQLGLF